MIQSQQLSQEITSRLLEEIRSGRYQSEDRLPPEVTLAEHMGVSRTLIRDCLSSLEREGFISRKHGVGTIINKHVIEVNTRMDLEKEFLEMVRDAGYQAGLQVLGIKQKAANAQVAAKLKRTEGDPIYQVIRLITADGRPAIYCIDHISVEEIKTEEYDEAELGLPIFHFLQKYCHVEVYMDLTEVRAIAAEPWLAEVMTFPGGAPVLYMDEIGYDFYGKPVLYSQEYYADGILKHIVMRKKI